MKKVLLIMAVITLAIISCEKEEKSDPNAITKESISGKWNVTEGQIDGKWVDASSLGWYAQFNSNLSYSAKMGDDTYSGTWSLSGRRITCDVSGYKVYYDVIEFNGTSAVVDISYQDDPDKLRLKVIKQ